MQYVQLGDTVYFHFAANDTAGSAADGASAACDVRQAGAAASDPPLISPTPELLTDAAYPAGAYEVAVEATEANGFSSLTVYAVFCTLAVDSQNPLGFVGSFKTGPILTGVSTGTPAVTATGGLSVDATTIIANAYDEIGRLNPDRSLSAEDGAFGFMKLNRLISVWRAQRKFVPAIVPTSFPFAVSQQSYTVGPTGDFVMVRPNKIVRANLVRTAGTEDEHIPLEILEMEQDYSQAWQPGRTAGEPDVLFVRYDYPNVRVFPWPYPTNDATALANELELWTWSPLSSFADMFTLYDFPDAYEDGITLTLAEALCSRCGVVASEELKAAARNARAVIASLNSKPPRFESTDGSVLSTAQRSNLRQQYWPR